MKNLVWDNEYKVYMPKIIYVSKNSVKLCEIIVPLYLSIIGLLEILIIDKGIFIIIALILFLWYFIDTGTKNYYKRN